MNAVPVDGLDDWIATGRCALLIVDMQVDFASPEGVLGRLCVDLSTVAAALDRATALATAARTAGVKVVFVGLQSSPDTDSPVWAERNRRLGEDVGEALCRRGSAGAAFVGPTPLSGELVVAKSRYSAFHGGDLDVRLRECGVDTLVICGLTTECCVEATARDAYQRDFHVFIATDACAAYDPELHSAALRSLAINCAMLATSERIVQAWRSPT